MSLLGFFFNLKGASVQSLLYVLHLLKFSIMLVQA